MSAGTDGPKAPIRVLLVEDDSDHRAIARRHLGKLTDLVSSVETAEDLAGALGALEGAGPAFGVVLLDLTLPDSPLEATVEGLGRLAALGGAPVIAMSSLDTEDVRRRVRDAGAAGFLSKLRLGPSGMREAIAGALGSAPPEPSDPGQPWAPTRPSDAFDPVAIASRLAHDAGSWLTNATFRLAAIRTEAEAAGADATLQHVAAIDASISALGDAIRGSRTLVLDEITAMDPTATSLAETLPSLVRSGPVGGAMGEVHGQGEPVLADAGALATLSTIVLDNASRARAGKRCTVRFDLEEHNLVITDDGGPWEVSSPEGLGTCGYRGRADSPQPGLGLFRARRLMERMGGRLTIEPRFDAPGAYALRLAFRPAPVSPPSSLP